MREARMFFEISLRFLVIFIYGFETCLFGGNVLLYRVTVLENVMQ